MKHKEKDKFSDLYNKEADNVYRFCLMRVSDKEIALDLLQETFMKYWTVLDSGEDVRNEKALLFKIARNLIIDFYRKKKAVSLEGLGGSVTDDDTPAVFRIVDETVDIEMEVESKHLIEKINDLSHPHREVVYMRFVEGLKPKEIAEVLNESANTVSVRLNRAIEELKKIAGYEIEE